MVEGSAWSATQSVYKLLACPTGYRVESVEGEEEDQECQPCDAGSHCVAENCTECVDCPEGAYKAASSTQACDLCPKDRYNPTKGRTSLGDCLVCPDGAHTVSEGQVGIEACVCEERFYMGIAIGQDGSETRSCNTCPKGAECQDKSCASLQNQLQKLNRKIRKI